MTPDSFDNLSPQPENQVRTFSPGPRHLSVSSGGELGKNVSPSFGSCHILMILHKCSTRDTDSEEILVSGELVVVPVG